MNMKKKINAIVMLICCLLLSGCGLKSEKWLNDIKKELGMRPDSVETFMKCIRQHQSIPAAKFVKQFKRQSAVVRHNRSTADWGNMACLAFNESATSFQAKTAALLLPEKNLASDEKLVVDLVRILLHKRAITLGRLDDLKKRHNKSLDMLDKLKSQIVRLQEIEGKLRNNQNMQAP